LSPRASGDGRLALGQRAEALAAAALEAVGMTIVARNWRRPQGELDIVARTLEGICVFCEVRSRTGEASGDPLETVTAHKQSRVIRAARHYLSEVEATAASGYRFDVVAVTFFTDGAPPRVVHIEAAFETT
jgi:putative endonuclease